MYGKYTVSPYDGVLSALGITDKYPESVNCDVSESTLRYNTSIGQDCWPALPVKSLEDCAKQCGQDTHCKFYVFDDRGDSLWCGFYPTDYMIQPGTGYIVGTCSKKEPEPVWQCNQDNICVATIDGSDQTAAMKLAAEADVVLNFLGSFAREGKDRENLAFGLDVGGVCQLAAANQDELVSAIASTGTPTVVVATAPGAMLTPWRNEVQVRGGGAVR